MVIRYMKLKTLSFLKYSLLAALFAVPSLGEDLVVLDVFPVQASMILRTADNFAQPVEIIGGETLNIRRAVSLGDTLSGLPGIADSGYYPGASRPIIRGFSNDRIRVLRNGLDLLDASVGSLDHAVAIEPFRLERIEILRGPAVLGFGGNTVGGMINVVDNLIPLQPITSGKRGYLGSHWDSASSGVSLSAAKGLVSGPNQWRVGGLIRRHGDISIRGRGAMDPELAAGQPDGRLENSFVHTDELALGWAMPGEQRALGMSGSYFATRYGLGRELVQGVAGFDGEGNPIVERELEDAVSIDLEQFRWDGVMEINDLSRWAESVEIKLGISDYEHSESEDGEVGTVFRSKGFEGRAEAAHSLSDRWSGVVGLQINHSYFEAAGGEAFLRPTWTTQAGVFVFENYDMDKHQFQMGARVDYRNIAPPYSSAMTLSGAAKRRRDFAKRPSVVHWAGCMSHCLRRR